MKIVIADPFGFDLRLSMMDAHFLPTIRIELRNCFAIVSYIAILIIGKEEFKSNSLRWTRPSAWLLKSIRILSHLSRYLLFVSFIVLYLVLSICCCLHCSLYAFILFSLSLSLSVSLCVSVSLSLCLSVSLCRSLSLCLSQSLSPLFPFWPLFHDATISSLNKMISSIYCNNIFILQFNNDANGLRVGQSNGRNTILSRRSRPLASLKIGVNTFQIQITEQGSISPTFYEQLFVWNCFAQLLCTYSLCL